MPVQPFLLYKACIIKIVLLTYDSYHIVMFGIKREVLSVNGLTRRILIQITQQEAYKTENGTFVITRPRFPGRKQKLAIDFVLYRNGECHSRSGGLIKDGRERKFVSEF